nr:tetratricopeptide repeat protein [Pirellulales bacterium]
FASDTYKSQYNEIDVSCETCHGPGSVHVDLAQGRSMFWDRRIRYGLTNTLKGASTERQTATCAPCHSRRSMVHPDYSAGDSYLNHFEPSLLHSGLYHADGQIQDEVFEHGSFTQSRMFREGVKCTDCHDPHSLTLKFEGNRLCAQCHQPGKYDGPAHHHHPNAAPGAPETQCVTCHMPTTTYMGIDHRRDHSIRVPRPDLTVKLGTPNVCNRCHTEPAEDAQWAADAVVKWYGDKRPDDPHHAEAIHAAQQGDAEGEGLIRRMLRRKETPEYIRATMIELLAAYPTEESLRLRREALTDDSPLVRAAAVRSLAGVLVAINRQIDELREAAGFNPAAQSQASQLTASLTELVKELEPLLGDPIRTVRFATASLLAEGLPPQSAVRDSSTFKDVIAEYRAGQSHLLDRAESHRNLANLALNLNDPVVAVESFRTAIRQQPYRTDFRTELSQLLAKIAADPTQAEVWKKIGGTEEEINRLREEEVGLLERDSKLLPKNAGPHFHRGRLLFLLQRPDEAGDAFAEATRLAPNNYEYWMWLALIRERQQRWDEAVEAVNKMAALQPGGGEWQGLYQRIEQSRRAGDTPAAKRDDDAARDAAPPATAVSPTQTLPANDPPTTPGQKQFNPDGN